MGQREIKFKFWEIPTQTMITEIDALFRNPSVIPSKIFNGSDKLIIPIEFTGRKDKEGVEIYHGDINQDGGVVIWNEDDASFCWEYKNVVIDPMGEEETWCIISGNIYQNPELIALDSTSNKESN